MLNGSEKSRPRKGGIAARKIGRADKSCAANRSRPRANSSGISRCFLLAIASLPNGEAAHDSEFAKTLQARLPEGHA